MKIPVRTIGPLRKLLAKYSVHLSQAFSLPCQFDSQTWGAAPGCGVSDFQSDYFGEPIFCKNINHGL